jgi:hypothetical protein
MVRKYRTPLKKDNFFIPNKKCFFCVSVDKKNDTYDKDFLLSIENDTIFCDSNQNLSHKCKPEFCPLLNKNSEKKGVVEE